MSRRARLLLVWPFLLAAALSACVFRHPSTRSVDVRAGDRVVSSAAKAHLKDGTTVLFPGGFSVRGELLVGRGTRYSLDLRQSAQVDAVRLDEVVGVESYHTSVNVPATLAGTAFGVAVGTVAAAALAVAIFGSCPTIYADSAGTPVLAAEGFSYSIAPLFEARDVDRLPTRVGDGPVELEVRNEAAETHYINHLELLVVNHDPAEVVVPDPLGHPVATGALAAPRHATDRAARDVTDRLAAADGNVFASDERILDGATADDLHDAIVLEFDTPPGDSAALVLRARNSLLTTVFLYEIMLEGQGASAVDWLGRDLQRIGTAIELGEWYVGEMGLHVEVESATGWREVGWIRDVGPIAWTDVAIVLPTGLSRSGETDGSGSFQVRLRFVADGWRIDRAMLGATVRRPDVRAAPLVAVLGSDGTPDPRARAAAAAPDEDYLQTTPGQSFTAVFDPGPRSDGETVLLASQGYYVEWMRPAWLTADGTPFRPANGRLFDALQRWRTVRGDYERRFFETRFPVR